jgi:hypothetical protein
VRSGADFFSPARTLLAPETTLTAGDGGTQQLQANCQGRMSFQALGWCFAAAAAAAAAAGPPVVMCLAVVTCCETHICGISSLRLAIGLHSQAANAANFAFHMLFPALFA